MIYYRCLPSYCVKEFLVQSENLCKRMSDRLVPCILLKFAKYELGQRF